MMTNVDLEGFRDWTDAELEQALEFIQNEQVCRKQEKINVALSKIEEGFKELEVIVPNIRFYFDEHESYTLGRVYDSVWKDVVDYYER